ncbi:MAG: carboxylesterase/lipase family protein [Blautia sp.]|nr:carboxylesterase/lipase family protein [Blautia sp.]
MKKHLCVMMAAMLALGVFGSAAAYAEEADASSAELVRQTQFGEVTGIEDADTGALIWYGIPYAAAPVGELRWAAPADPEAWTEALDCTEPAEPGMQYATDYATGETKLIGTEDCLNLDVYTRPDAGNLPVLVYVHGGNNQTGKSGEIPGRQIVYDNNCVYVSLNYRLGLFGFNCLPALLTEEGSTGNFTMLDIAKALDWVKANISAFGGDPENITVSGFSAGGRDVMAMLVSPLFAGKFNKAIAFSGGMTIADQAASASQIAGAIAPLAVEDGLFEDEAAAKDWLLTDGEDVKEYLFGLTPDRVCALMGNAGIRMSAFPHLYNDGIVLPEEGFDTDTYNNVPLLMLTGATEFSLFCNFDGYFFSPAITELDEETQEAAKAFARLYGSDMYRIFNGQCSAEKMFDKYQEKIYLAQVEYGSVNSATFLPAMGSFHGIFVPMLTNDHTYGGFGDFTVEGFQAMAAQFDRYLANFLAAGDPNGEDLTEWPAWTPENEASMVFDADETSAIIEARDVSTTYEDILAQMDADDSVPEDTKNGVIQNVMNGRWFSAALDEHYGNESLWQ